MKASVLPEPVQASTATSLLEQSIGTTAACTGVARSKPQAASAASVEAQSCGFSDMNSGPASKPRGVAILPAHRGESSRVSPGALVARR